MNKDIICNNCGKKNCEWWRRYFENGKYSPLLSWLDDAYQPCKKYLDNNFKTELESVNIFPRIWELAVCEKLVNSKFTLLSANKKGRPDFCVIGERGEKIWIEAVISEDSKFLKKHHNNSCQNPMPVSIPEDEIILSYRNTIQRKIERINEYRRKGIVGDQDFVILAISGFSSINSQTEYFVNSIFPRGPQSFQIQPDGSVRQIHVSREVVLNKNKSPVSTDLLTHEEKFGIDAFLWSEISDKAELLGNWSSYSNKDTEEFHIFQTVSGKEIPIFFRDNFQYWSVAHFNKDKDSGVELKRI